MNLKLIKSNLTLKNLQRIENINDYKIVFASLDNACITDEFLVLLCAGDNTTLNNIRNLKSLVDAHIVLKDTYKSTVEICRKFTTTTPAVQTIKKTNPVVKSIASKTIATVIATAIVSIFTA